MCLKGKRQCDRVVNIFLYPKMFFAVGNLKCFNDEHGEMTAFVQLSQ